jgi:hypothetical protein
VPWPGPSFAEAGKPFGTPITAEALGDLDAHHWELYHVAEDLAENHDLAAEHRDKLIELIALWYVEAGKYGVLPIDGSGVARMVVERPQLTGSRVRYSYWPGTQTLPFAVSPRVLNRPHSIAADVEIPAGGAEGVLLCQGASTGGWTLYLKDRKLHYAHNYVHRALYQVSSADAVPLGRHQLRFEFEPTGTPDIANGKGSPGRGTKAARRRRTRPPISIRSGRPDRAMSDWFTNLCERMGKLPSAVTPRGTRLCCAGRERY